MSVQYARDNSSVTEPVTFVSTPSSLSASSSGFDARLLSQATSQATIAAKSILSSGGTEQTALKTAKAAAQGVLLGNIRDLGSGPKGMMKRRKIKKQAEVVTSMALVSASNSHRQGTEWDLLSNTDTQLDHKLQMMQVQYDMNQSPSVMSSLSKPHSSIQPDTRSVTSGSQKSMSSRNLGRPPISRNLLPPGARSTAAMNMAPTISARASNNIPESIREEPSMSLSLQHSADEVSEQDITRQVAIRVETTSKSSKKENPRTTSVESNMKGENLKYFTDKTKASTTSDVGRYKAQKYEDDSDFDDASNASIFSDDASSHNSVKSTTSSFMANTVDPLILSLANAFRCGPTTPVASTSAVAASDTTEKNKARAMSVDERQPSSSSCSSVESDELFRSLRSYEEYALSDESRDSNERSREGKLHRNLNASTGRGERTREGPENRGSHSEDDARASESDESQNTEESYEYKEKAKINAQKKPWQILRVVSRKKSNGRNADE